jgi:hypothetical protein
MGTFLVDKCNEIRGWLTLGVELYPDTVVVPWIRMAEEYFSTGLRVKHMIQIDTSVIKDDRVPLPLDWQEIRFARFLPSTGAIHYTTPDAFFSVDPDTAEQRKNKYTILGNYLMVNPIDYSAGSKVELTYYQNIPPLTNEANNWINIYSPTIYTLKINHIASLYSIEDERGPVWDQEVVRLVNAMNERHKIDMASGSVLIPVRRKSFG